MQTETGYNSVPDLRNHLTESSPRIVILFNIALYTLILMHTLCWEAQVVSFNQKITGDSTAACKLCRLVLSLQVESCLATTGNPDPVGLES